MNNKTITVETTINATIEKVWTLYTEPKHITKWNNASPDWHSPSAKNDLKKGGKFSIRMEAKDKSEGFDFEGTYDEVKKHELIAYTMTDKRKTRVEFQKQGTQTKITITFDAETINSHELQKTGWQAILDNFKAYVEKQ